MKRITKGIMFGYDFAKEYEDTADTILDLNDDVVLPLSAIKDSKILSLIESGKLRRVGLFEPGYDEFMDNGYMSNVSIGNLVHKAAPFIRDWAKMFFEAFNKHETVKDSGFVLFVEEESENGDILISGQTEETYIDYKFRFDRDDVLGGTCNSGNAEYQKQANTTYTLIKNISEMFPNMDIYGIDVVVPTWEASSMDFSEYDKCYIGVRLLPSGSDLGLLGDDAVIREDNYFQGKYEVVILLYNNREVM